MIARIGRFVRWLFEPAVPDVLLSVDAAPLSGGAVQVEAGPGVVWLTLLDQSGRGVWCGRMTPDEAEDVSTALFRAAFTASMAAAEFGASDGS